MALIITATKLISITLLSVVIIALPHKLIQGHEQQQVPCAFFFGDSLFDNGNNNLLVTLAKVNFLPYGIDFPNGPTGRFSNGRNTPDFLAEFLGFDEPIPPYATATDSEILNGVNYASGGAGIRDETGLPAGDRASLNRQILNHKIAISRIGSLLKYPITVEGYLSKCLYTINMGSNDYLNNYLLPQYYSTSLLYTTDQFAEILIQQYSQQLRDLYKYGARKVVVFAVGQIGCIPQQLATIPAGNGLSCVDSANNAAQLFNNRLKPLIDNLNSNLPDAQFIFINTTSISYDPSAVGITVTNVPCCVVNPITGLCDPDKVVCSNRDEYAYWDNYHPTEALNRVAVTRAYNSVSPFDSYPFDIRRLVQLIL